MEGLGQMGKNLAGKTGFIVAVLVIFIYGIFGIPHSTGNGFGDSLKQSLLNRIHLGLDLKGGTHLVLKVHTAEAINSATDRDVQSLNTALTPLGASATKLDPANHPEVITVTGGTAAQSSDIRSALTGNEYSAYDVASAANSGFTMTMKQSAMRDMNTRTLDVSMEAIRQRIDSLGVAEPVIEKYGLGDDQILVELPGVEDVAHVESIIQSTAKLEVHEVVGDAYPDEASALQALGGVLPPDEELVRGSATGTGPDQVWVLKRASVVEGTDFRDAQPSRDENGHPDLTFTLTTEAGDRFYKYTDSVKGTGRMAIVLENKVREVAGIQGAIRDTGRITGGFTEDQAKDLSLMLRTGSLPASISYTETRTVGPSLGAASIRQGVIAAIAGMLVVMVFMLIYYRGAGINADLALLLNLVILLGFMGFSGATLTLPGIAGVILTIGMGVDSNVLIFERIREELRLGKTSAAAVQEGFGHAWVTIIDTHVTTIVSAAILFILGTGPVKGFAVTLTIGLLANLFTAVFVSRTIFDYLLSKRERTAALSI
jgi:preprotein translocase subunit SecD